MRYASGVAAALWLAVFVASPTLRAGPGQPFVGVLDEHPAIQYERRPATDRVSQMNRSLTSGASTLSFQGKAGYLASVLSALGVSAESQLLVFSKTGIQGGMTGPETPRALFFDHSVVVGYVPGAPYLEIASHDPQQGVIFYTLDQNPSVKPTFSRQTKCLTCHVSAATLEVPGLIARSNFMSSDGMVVPQLGSFTVDHRTPLIERWGGWFVTGDYTPQPYGTVVHMGNVTGTGTSSWGPETTSNEVFIRWLNSDFRMRGYPSEESDISSLLVFDHQAHAVNLLTRLNWETRVAAGDGRADFGSGPLRNLVDELADYLLFVGEAPPPTRITPRRGFAEKFAAAAPRDRAGRSLRDLDLETRLLRYPCSYIVYADAFQSLPAAARTAVYDRLWQILSNHDRAPKYSHLSTADRRAIIEILRDTIKDLPAAFASAS